MTLSPRHRLRSTGMLVALVGVLSACGASPGPSESSTASPSVVAVRPYRLSLLSAQGSPGPTRSIATPADCDTLPTDWSRSVCALTLRSDWHAIIAPTDPFAAPPNGYSSPTWIASMARAQIDGDRTLCSDVTMREWISASSNPVAPPPGPTPTPVGPIGSCLDALRSTTAQGSFSVENAAGENMLKFFVDPGAVARAAGGSAPAFDPKVLCTSPPGSGRESLTRDVCNQLVDAVTTALGSRRSAVQALFAYPVPIECLKSAPAACPSPSGGSWLGGVVAALAGNQGFGFDVTEVGGQVTVAEVPYKP